MRQLIIVFVSLIALVVATLAYAGLSGSLAESAIVERIKPVGQVRVEASSEKDNEPKAPIGNAGEAIYKKSCHVCHSIGISGAPKLHNKNDWASRLKTGKETLLNHVLHGYKAMPAKGGCINCSEDDLRRAIDYMSGS